jgi:hypothetical protein
MPLLLSLPAVAAAAGVLPKGPRAIGLAFLLMDSLN